MASKGDRTRHRILTVAGDLFWKHSYRGTNMNTVCSTASVNKATAYSYFASKQDLALAAIEDLCQRTVTHVFEASFQAATDPVARLEGIYHRVYQTHQQVFTAEGISPGCPFINMGAEAATEQSQLRAAVEGCFTRFAGFYQQLVQDAVQQGADLSPLSEAEAVQALINLMNGAMITSKIRNSPEDIRGTLPAARRILGA